MTDSNVEAIDEVLAAIDIPPTLADLGVREADLELVSESSLKAKRLVDNNPVPLDLQSVTRIVRAAFVGDRALNC